MGEELGLTFESHRKTFFEKLYLSLFNISVTFKDGIFAFLKSWAVEV